jgi:hypothetical protein
VILNTASRITVTLNGERYLLHKDV